MVAWRDRSLVVMLAGALVLTACGGKRPDAAKIDNTKQIDNTSGVQSSAGVAGVSTSRQFLVKLGPTADVETFVSTVAPEEIDEEYTPLNDKSWIAVQVAEPTTADELKQRLNSRLLQHKKATVEKVEIDGKVHLNSVQPKG